MLSRILGPGLLFALLAPFGLLAGLSATQVAAQVSVSGIVVDAATNDALPGASIQLEGTFTGTITNSAGQFSLTVPSLPAVLIVRFIGYQSSQIEIRSAEQGALRISMLASTIALPALTVTGEDPAIGIMRRVIEEKVKWRASLKTYAVTAYNRFRMENDSGIVSIWESGTRAFWDVKRGVREVSLWQQTTQNMDFSDMMPAAMFVMNLYDDNVEVAGHNLMGVTHPKALSFYDFSLEDIRARDEAEVYIINVQPKRKTSAGFVGQIAVLDGAYAMISAELRPGEAFLFPPPIQWVTTTYAQQFSNFGLDTWLPVDFRADMDVKVGMDGILVFPEFKIRQLSSLTDFEINVELPDTLYAQRETVVVDSSLIKMEVLPAQRVGVPLTEDEVKAYATIDSTMTIEKAYEPTGLMARFVKSDNNDQGTRVSVSGGVSSSGGKLPFTIRPDAWFNRVEGYHVGLKSTIKPASKVRLTGAIAYASAQKGWSYDTGVEVGKKVTLVLGYADKIVPQFESDVHGRLFNSYRALTGEEEYFDYFRRSGWRGVVTTAIPGHRRVKASIALKTEVHSSLAQKSFSSLFAKELFVRTNQAVSEGRLHSVSFRLAGEDEDLPVPVGPQKRWRLDMEQSLGGSLLSSNAFTRFEGMVLWRIPTFFKRRLLANALDIRVVAGTILGSDLPIQKLGMVDGSSRYTTFGSIKTLQGIPYRGSTWGLVAWDHTFRTVPFEIVGWDWAIRRHWNVIVHGAHGKTWLKKSDARVRAPGQFHHELGISLSGVLSVLRLDAAWRLDQRDFRLGIALARIF